MPFDDKEFILTGRWGTCCMKQYPADVVEYQRNGYEAFGVILNRSEPVTIYLRGENPADDWKKTKCYPTIDAMLADRWVVD